MRLWNLLLLGLSLSASLATPSFATSLSGHLSPSDVGRITEIIGTGAVSKTLRGADSYEAWPGIKIGFELLVVTTRNLNDLGDQNGSLPTLLPAPRLFLAKGLSSNLELSANFMPTGIFNTVITWGAMLKWTWLPEQDNWAAGAAYFGFTHFSAFHETLSGNDLEFGALFSKDFVRMKPYLGVALLMARADIAPFLSVSPVTSGSFATLHSFVGAEFELPISLTVQIDLFGVSPGASFFMGFKF